MEEDFEEIRRIGKGAEGSVYLVRRYDNGEEFVIKKIFLKGNRSTSIHEAKILSQLKHPHVVRYHDSFVDRREEHLCIVTDYCEGGNLDQRIRAAKKDSRRFSEEPVMNWFVQIAGAMQYIHSKNILHRDLKTANIFLTKHDIIKVGDFGIAAQLEHTLDMKRTCVGSPYYMSPEVCQDIPYNNKSDVWAMGCVLYELCCLEPAFGGNNLMRIVNKIVGGAYTPIAESYSPDLHGLVDAMLQVDSADRPSVAEILCLPYVKKCLKSFIQSAEQKQLAIRNHHRDSQDEEPTLTLEGTNATSKKRTKTKPRKKKMSKADSGYLMGILPPRHKNGVPDSFVLTGTTTTLQKKSSGIPALSVRPPTARSPSKRADMPQTSRSHPPIGYMPPGSPQRPDRSRGSDRGLSRGSDRSVSRGSARSHSRGSSGDSRDTSPAGGPLIMPPIHRRNSINSDEDPGLQRSRSLKSKDSDIVPGRPRTRSDTNVMQKERNNRLKAQEVRHLSRSPPRSPARGSEEQQRTKSKSLTKTKRTRSNNDVSSRGKANAKPFARSTSNGSLPDSDKSTQAKTKKPLPGSPRLSNVRASSSKKIATSTKRNGKASGKASKPKKTRKRSLAPTPTARRSVEEPEPQAGNSKSPAQFLADNTVPSDIASQFEELLRQRCDMESTDSSSAKSTVLANGALPDPHEFGADTMLSQMSRISTPSDSGDSDHSSDGDDNPSDRTVSIMNYGGQHVIALAEDAYSDSFESVTGSSDDDDDRPLSPDSLDEDEDVMAMVDVAREALSSRAEDYSDATIEDRTIATPPRALLRAHCLEALGETVFARAYDYFKTWANKPSRDDGEKTLEAVVGKQNLRICPLVQELVALETRKFSKTIATISRTTSKKIGLKHK